MKDVKHDINAFSPEELREAFITLYAETFERSREHAAEMFLCEHAPDHDFVTLANVEATIAEIVRFCS